MSRRNQPAANPAARIARLKRAIGDGPHAANIDPFDVLVCVLRAIGDVPAMRLLYASRETR